MRKLGAHYILDETGNLLPYSYLVVDDSGSILDIVSTGGNLDSVDSLEFYNGILVPGFINAHCHLELSHLKGVIEPHCSLHNFIKQVVTQRGNDESAIENAIVRADKEMQNNGIVAVGDISNNAGSFHIKKSSPIYYHTFIEVFGTGEYALSNYENARILYEIYHSSLPLSLSPHAPYSVSPVLHSELRQHSERNNTIQSIHNQETESENLLFEEKKGALYDQLIDMGFQFDWISPNGKNSLQTVLPQMANDVPLLLVHNTYSTKSDYEFAINRQGKSNCFFVACPRSNEYIDNAVPNLRLAFEYSDHMVVGTDSLASNYSLSILDELKFLHKHAPFLPLEAILQWSTRNGAIALGLESKYGSFSKGKSPGVNLITGVDLENKILLDRSQVKVLVQALK